MCNLVKEENAFRLSANLKSRLLTDIRVSEISNKYQRREELIWLPKDNVCFWRYNKYVSTMYVFEDITRKHVGFGAKAEIGNGFHPAGCYLPMQILSLKKELFFF